MIIQFHDPEICEQIVIPLIAYCLRENLRRNGLELLTLIWIGGGGGGGGGGRNSTPLPVGFSLIIQKW